MESSTRLKVGLWVLVLAIAAALGCNRSEGTPGATNPVKPNYYAPVATPPAPGATTLPGGIAHYDVGGVPLPEPGVVVAEPAVFDNLTVFPILASNQVDVGPVVDLDTALDRGVAEVREIGAREGGPSSSSSWALQPAIQQQQLANGPPRANQPLAQQMAGGGAEVGTLVIENRGDFPIYVLAGTVVKGGKQDRQIGQDFIISPKTKVPVDAFCVEHGRWSGQRGGKSTGGKFKTIKQLANIEVRKAGQYESDQGKVWKKVSAVNKANRKSSSSDSLLASLDDGEIVAKRAALAGKVLRHLQTVAPARSVVGVAYAVNGRVKGVRWFVNHDVFSLFREVMVNTSAMDAITDQQGGATQGPPPKAATVARFVTEAAAAKTRKVKATQAGNVNEYVESDKAFGSTTVQKMPSGKGVKMSSDFVAK
ncbi:MAG: hypothetical protein JRI68_28455 [Deltaproteobacteria bacterium]|nr:hypothetical protein [Deltaproteobacteria bacterium]